MTFVFCLCVSICVFVVQNNADDTMLHNKIDETVYCDEGWAVPVVHNRHE